LADWFEAGIREERTRSSGSSGSEEVSMPVNARSGKAAKSKLKRKSAMKKKTSKKKKK
jgi:hypothetical protein